MTNRAPIVGGLLLAAMSFVATGAAAQFDSFDWTFVDSGGLGFGTLTNDEMYVTGPDFNSFAEHSSFYVATAPTDGTVCVHLSWANTDQQLQFDWAAYTIDGVDHSIWNAWSYSNEMVLMFDVPAGASFGLGVMSQDSWGGPLLASYTDFRFLPATASAVDVVTSGEIDDEFGSAVAGLGDVNGDGVPDIAIGAPGSDSNGVDSGRIEILSGTDGSLIDSLVGAAAGDRFGHDLDALGDINGDGVPDLIVGAPFSDLGGLDAGAVLVLSGADRSTIRTHVGDAANDQFGTAVAGTGDTDGDGVADVLVGAPLNDELANKAGKAHLFSGSDGSVLHEWLGANLRDEFGTSVDGLGDADGDGLADVAIGAPLLGENVGSVWVYSGSDGSQLWTASGDAWGDKLGLVLAGAGDIDGDGLGDLILGLPAQAWGSVQVRRGLDGTLLHDIPSYPFITTAGGLSTGTFMGRAVGGAGDVDDDGRDDFMFSALPFLPGTVGYGAVFVFSGRTGEVLSCVHGDFATPYNDLGFGASIDAAGDLDGDGLPEIVVGSSGGISPEVVPGLVRSVRIPVVWADLGAGLAGAGGVPTLDGIGLMQGDTPYHIRLTEAAPTSATTLVVGFAELGAPFKGGVLIPNPDLLVSGLFTDASGAFALSGVFPVGLPAGIPFWLQAWIVDGGGPAGFAASNGLRAITW